jgi:hypothetical protein
MHHLCSGLGDGMDSIQSQSRQRLLCVSSLNTILEIMLYLTAGTIFMIVNSHLTTVPCVAFRIRKPESTSRNWAHRISACIDRSPLIVPVQYATPQKFRCSFSRYERLWIYISSLSVLFKQVRLKCRFLRKTPVLHFSILKESNFIRAR